MFGPRPAKKGFSLPEAEARPGLRPAGRPDRGTVREHLVVIALLLAAELLIFHHELFQGAALYFQVIRDPNPILLSSSWYAYSAQALAEGIFPLWNPWNGLGTPQIANYQSGFFSPLLAPLFLLPLPATAVPYLGLRLLLAGWGTYLYGRNLQWRHWPAVLAGLAFALSGWMIQYVNNQHLVIDLLLPFFFWSLDRLAQRPRIRSVLALSTVIALILLGGQPSSALFTLSLGLAYALSLRIRSWRSLLLMAIPWGLGALWSLVQTFPFLEYLPQAWTYHPPGFGLQHLPLATAITLLAPGFFGLTGQQHLPVMMVLPYLGAVPLALALAALRHPRRLSPVARFFLATAFVSLGLIHGLPPLAQVMALPGLNLLTFFKYFQPLLTFAVAVLAGESADRLASRDRARAFRLTLALLILVAVWDWNWIPETRSIRLASCGLSAGILLGGWLFCKRPRALALLAGFGLIADASFNSPLVLPQLAPKDLSRLSEFRSGPPNYPRLAATEEIFVPNHGVPWKVDDLRVTDGIFVGRMIRFLDLLNGHRGAQGLNYLAPYNHTRVVPDPARWQGPLAQLARLRWFLSREPLPPNLAIAQILEQARVVAPGPDYVALTAFDLAGDFRRVLYQHPPGRIEIPAELTDHHSGLKFALALDPRQWSEPGDGVWFAASAGGRLLLARHLNPAGRTADRRWLEEEFAFPGPGPAALVTLPGPGREQDWAGWGDLRWREAPAAAGLMQSGYRVYENAEAFPLALIVGEWLGVKSQAESEAWLKTSRDFRNAAVVEGAGSSLPAAPPPAGGVQVLEKSDSALSLAAAVDREALLVITDNYFPGWQARVNGTPVRIFPADLTFRGILLPPGASRVELVYRPWAFRVGLYSTLVSLLAAGAVRLSRRRRSVWSGRAPVGCIS